METAAPFRADWKGIVEKQFHLRQADFAPYVPGYIQTDYQERGGTDYRDPDMVADDVKAIPADLWEWGIQRRSGRLKHYPHNLVKLSLLPVDEASITESGIAFYGCFYSCSKAMKEYWFDRARQRGRQKVRVSYDPRCMDAIYLHDQREAFIPCSLTDRSENYRSMSLWEIDQIRQLDRSIIANHELKKIIGKVNLARAVKEKVDEAVAMKKQQPEPSASKRSKTSNIRTNRAQEKESLRSRDAFHQKPQRQPQATRVLAIEGAQVENDEFDLSEVTPSLLNFRRENPVDKS